MPNTPDQWSQYASPAPPGLTGPMVPLSPAPTSPTADPWSAYAVGSSAPATSSINPVPLNNTQAPDPWAQYAKPQATPASADLSDDDTPTSTIGRAWAGANKPLTESVFDLPGHRAGAGGIETGVEEFASSLTSPLSVGLALLTAGGSLGEEALTQAGVSAVGVAKAAGYAKAAKIGADFGFLAKFGYDVGTQAIPSLERDWNDYNATTDDGLRDKLLNKMEQDGTGLVLGALASGLATRGLSSDIREAFDSSAKGKAMSQNPEYEDAVYNYQGTHQNYNIQADQINRTGMRAIPDELRQEAISNNMEANGDANLLRKRMALVPDDKKPGYEAATNLTAQEMAVRDKLAQQRDANREILRDRHLLAPDGGLPNYVPHVATFDEVDPDTGEVVNKTGANAERGFLKARLHPTFAEGEAAGTNYATKNATKLFANNHEQVGNVIARDDLAKDLSKARMGDGSDMAVSGGYLGHPADTLLTPADIAGLKAAGHWDNLIKKGRVYEVPNPPSTATPVGSESGIAPVGPIPQQLPLLPADISNQPTPLENGKVLTQPTSKFYQKFDDFKDSGLTTLVPLKNLDPKTQAMILSGTGPVPHDALAPTGAQGFPRDPLTNEPMVRMPVYVHPDITPHVTDMLDTSAPKNKFVRTALKASSGLKSMLLADSPFHFVTIGLRTGEMMMNPLKTGQRLIDVIRMPDTLDGFNLSDKQQFAIDSGTVIGNTRPGYSGYAEEGLAAGHESWASKIPVIGGVNKWIESRLFGPQGFISAIKFDAFDKQFEAIKAARPELTDTQAGRIAASQTNNKFGGLNYTVMGRGAGTQDTLRALLLAPDFLESTARSVGDLAGPYGTNLVNAFVGFNMFHWLAARVLNKLNTGEYHAESGFTVNSQDGKKQYGLRTTLGDFLHFAEAPREFMANRVNPTIVRTPIELALGVDAQGKKVAPTQQMWDAARQVIPMPLQTLTPKQTISQPDWKDELMKSAGVQSRKKFTMAENLAYKLSTEKSSGAPLEGHALEAAQMKYKLEDDLRTALQTKDVAGYKAASKAIMDAEKAGTITSDEQTKLMKDAALYPTRLAATIARLPGLEDALNVYDLAGVTEKQQIRLAINKKIQAYYGEVEKGKKSYGDYKSLQPKIQRFFIDKPPATPTTASPISYQQPAPTGFRGPTGTVDDVAAAITRAEGAKPEIHNPGNIKDPSTNQIRTFSTIAEGKAALAAQIQQIKRDIQGNKGPYAGLTTLRQVGHVYSNGDPDWARNVASALHVSEDSLFADLF